MAGQQRDDRLVHASRRRLPVAVEDDWNVENPFDLAAKWNRRNVAEGRRCCSGRFAPHLHQCVVVAADELGRLAAEGPWTHHSIGINSRLANCSRPGPADAILGTAVMDYPGYLEMQICPAIIARNHRLQPAHVTARMERLGGATRQ